MGSKIPSSLSRRLFSSGCASELCWEGSASLTADVDAEAALGAFLPTAFDAGFGASLVAGTFALHEISIVMIDACLLQRSI